jgi:hypothetical protein
MISIDGRRRRSCTRAPNCTQRGVLCARVPCVRPRRKSSNADARSIRNDLDDCRCVRTTRNRPDRCRSKEARKAHRRCQRWQRAPLLGRSETHGRPHRTSGGRPGAFARGDLRSNHLPGSLHGANASQCSGEQDAVLKTHAGKGTGLDMLESAVQHPDCGRCPSGGCVVRR